MVFHCSISRLAPLLPLLLMLTVLFARSGPCAMLLPAFATVTDLITHLRTNYTRYRAALPAEDHFLSLCPTTLTVDLLEERLLAAETSITAVGASRGDPPVRLLLARGAATARASGARALEEVAGKEVVAVEAEEGVGVGVEAKVGASVAAVEVEAAVAVAVGVEAAEAATAEVELVEVELCSGDPSTSHALVRPRRHCSFVNGTQSGVAIFDLDFDAILAAMYAVSISAEGDCYVRVPPNPGIEAARLGASEAAALGASESAAPGASESALSGTASAQVLNTFTLDSGASRSFFQDRTTLTPLNRSVAVSLADPSGGPVLAHYSTVLPCPAAPSGSLSGLYLPSFSTNLVAASSQVFAAASWSGPESAPCSCLLLSHQTLLWHHRLGHPSFPRLRGMASRVLGHERYFLLVVDDYSRYTTVFPLHSKEVESFPLTLCRAEGIRQTFTLLASPQQNGIAERRIGPSTCMLAAGTGTVTPRVVRVKRHLSGLRTCRPPTGGVLSPILLLRARVRGQGHERYFLLVVDDYSRYTTVFPLHSKEVESFPLTLCRAEGIRQTFTLLASPQQNGIAERRIGMVMDVARTSMIHAAAPHFLWTFAVQYAAHQINLQPRGSRAFVRDLSADKLSSRAVPYVFLGFPLDAPGWQFFHPTSSRFRTTVSSPTALRPSPPLPLFLTPVPPPVDPLPPQCPAPSGVSQVDAVEPIEVDVDSSTSGGAEPECEEPGGAGSGGAEPERAEPGGAGSGGVEPERAEPGGAGSRVVLTGHADASWVDDLATQRSSQGYTFSLGSDSVSWRSTRSSSVLSSSCEAKIYAGGMAAQELRWLTYLLIDLGEPPRSPPILFVNNKAMLALCREHRLEHRTKHIALRYFLALELEQRG
ncbi:unnamed protein product [Closterium sp. NIES-53]